jgi:hypothetical protein
VLYSRWDPTSGVYDYFEAEATVGLNDDLPVPALPAGTAIGVPSVLCGRPLPDDAVAVGEGELARGSIIPSMSSGDPIGAIIARGGWFVPAALGAALGFAVSLLWRKR